MTAQVVILNKLAVAAASDSSVTLTTPDGRQRPFPSAEKIYPLPSPHAVVALRHVLRCVEVAVGRSVSAIAFAAVALGAGSKLRGSDPRTRDSSLRWGRPA
jgi:hypothetical protein